MKRVATLLVVAAVLTSLVTACAAPTPQVIEKEVVVEKEVPVTVAPSAAVPIKIGINLSLTGPKADFGTMDWESVQLAYRDFGVSEIGGRAISFIVEDNRGDPATAKSAEEKLATLDKVELVIGVIPAPVA